MKKFFVVLIATLLAAGAAAVVLWSGAYNIAASSQHTQAVYSLLEYTMRRSVRLRASGIVPPPLNTPGLFERGAACYQDRCEQCHGAPGVAQNDIALGMQPLPGPLVDASVRWNTRELYWITRNGITMSGMPAWQFQLSEQDMWSLVAFIERLPLLSPVAYQQIVAPRRATKCSIDPDAKLASSAALSADAVRGKAALSQYGCNGCHKIPGITGADVDVGPPLAGLARRQLIAGEIANTADQMVRWLRNPQEVDPSTAMPNLGVTERDARDMAAFLATLL